MSIAPWQWRPVADAATWEQVNAALPQAPHALQSWTWGAFKARWGWTMHPLQMVDEANRPVASALVLRRQLPRLPLAILYVPQGPTLDYGDGQVRRAALDGLQAYARARRAIFLKIDPPICAGRGAEEIALDPLGTAWQAALAARGWRYSASQVQFPNTVTLDLTRTDEELLAAMKQKTRYNIRLATRKDVVVRAVTAADFPLLSAMYRETAARGAFAIRPEAYYLDAWRSLQQDGLLHGFIATYDETPLAAILLVRSGPTAIYMYGASSENERQRMPAYLLQWEGIRWARAAGCTSYDMWGAPTRFDEQDMLWGVWRFKSGFNGDVVRHIGAWDFPARPFWYWVYATLIPRYLTLLRGRSRNALHGGNNG